MVAVVKRITTRGEEARDRLAVQRGAVALPLCVPYMPVPPAACIQLRLRTHHWAARTTHGVVVAAPLPAHSGHRNGGDRGVVCIGVL